MRYLGIEANRPRIAVFDFTGCEGCELQLANKEDTLHHFLDAIEVVRFREVSSADGGEYDIALVDGAITRKDEVERLRKIREEAKVLVALGSCACFGGVSKLKNAFDLDAANREVYGEHPKDTMATRPLSAVVPVDLEVPGCPVSKEEVERLVKRLAWDVPFAFPFSPVCLECKYRGTSCLFLRGMLCLGSITRGGCGAPCPAGGLGCWGCRGPAADANRPAFLDAVRARGFGEVEITERISFFGGFEEGP